VRYGIDYVSTHIPSHSYATRRPGSTSGVIQYLGHAQLESSIVYLHVGHVALVPRLHRLASEVIRQGIVRPMVSRERGAGMR
jgi:hypothetical protein